MRLGIYQALADRPTHGQYCLSVYTVLYAELVQDVGPMGGHCFERDTQWAGPTASPSLMPPSNFSPQAARVS
jgi:hypothetical protein